MPRNVVWVEIKKTKYFIYLAEMEQKRKESGHSTLIFYDTSFAKIKGDKFKELLILTAFLNDWPKSDSTYRKVEHTDKSDIFLKQS